MMPFGVKWLYNVSLFFAALFLLLGLVAVSGIGDFTSGGELLSRSGRLSAGLLLVAIGMLSVYVCDATAQKKWWARIGLLITSTAGNTFLFVGLFLGGTVLVALLVSPVILIFTARYLFGREDVVAFFRDAL